MRRFGIGGRAGVTGAAIGLAALAAAVLWILATSWRPAVASYPIQGVDVTAAAGAIDWATVRAGGADFVYVRATHGVDGRDASFATYWSAAYAAGLRRGALHEYAPCRPAVDQANNFMVVVPRTTDALPAAVAIDDDPACTAPPARAALVAGVARFVALVERHTGKPVILRIAPATERRYRLSAVLDRSLWATGDFFSPAYLGRPWRMWRANGRRRIDGAEGTVGWNVVAR